jgi:hypothetical protein
VLPPAARLPPSCPCRAFNAFAPTTAVSLPSALTHTPLPSPPPLPLPPLRPPRPPLTLSSCSAYSLLHSLPFIEHRGTALNAPHHSECVPPPLKPHVPSPPPPPPLPFNHVRGFSHEAFRERRACRTCACAASTRCVHAVGALSREAVFGATGERVLAISESHRHAVDEEAPAAPLAITSRRTRR